MATGHLPEELVVEIMSWLPPESLVQSKLVSKHWYSLIASLINDPTFVSKHLRNLNEKPTIAMTCLRVFHNPVAHYKELFSLLSLSAAGENITAATEFLDLPNVADEKDMSCVTASHCDGVICLADYYHDIVLTNPAMKKSRVLPRPTLVDRFSLQGVGFGYDANADDYKVVRFGRDMSVSPRAELYSLRSNSWKEIRVDSGTDYFPALHAELYFEGCFYWLMSGPRHAVRCFDMSEGVFRHVELPESVDVAGAHWAGLGVWNGSVALLLCVGERRIVEVWGVKDGVCVSTVGPFDGVDCPLAMWNSEEILMRGSNFKELLSYNVRRREIRNVGVGLDAIGCRAFSFVKSLVSV